jgi:hypothetical protein
MPSPLLLQGSAAVVATQLRQIAVWSDLECAGGSVIRYFDTITECEATFTLDNDNRLKLVVPLNAPVRDDLLEHRVIRIVESDVVFDEWRILSVNQDTQAGRVTITALSPIADLGTASMLRRTTGTTVEPDVEVDGLNVSQILQTVILPSLVADGLDWVAAGNLETIGPVSATFSWVTPLEACRQIAEITGTEFRLRRNGTGSYLIDFVDEAGSDAATADVRLGKNILALAQDRTQAGQVTIAQPRGARVDDVSATMARAQWRVTAVSGNDVTLADPAGGMTPIAFDDQLNGLTLRRTDGTLTAISATVAATDTVTVANAAGVSVNDLVQFRNGDGTDLIYLHSPGDSQAWGRYYGVVDRPDIPGATNLVPNAAVRQWSGAGTSPPDGWSIIGSPTLARENSAAFLYRGPNAIKVTANLGNGVQTASVPVSPTEAEPYASGWVAVYATSAASVKVELVVNGAVVAPTSPQVASNDNFNQYVALGVSGIDIRELAATSIAIRVTANTSPTTFYVAGAMITQTPSQEPLFVEGSGGTALWQAANRVLLRLGGPQVGYKLSLVDLARLDPDTWGEDCALVLGGQVRVTDERVNVQIQTRVTELTLDYVTRGNSAIQLSTLPEDLAGTLARPGFRRRLGAPTTVAAITGLALLSDSTTALRLPDGSKQSRIRATWLPLEDSFLDHYEPRGRVVGTLPWTNFPPVPAAQHLAYIPVSSDTDWEIAVRGVNRSNVPGPWTSTTLRSGIVTVERFQRNLVVNGDGQGSPSGSPATGWTTGAGPGLFVTDTQAKFGDRALTITTSGSQYAYSLQDLITVAANEVFRASGWVRQGTLGGSGSFGAGFEVFATGSPSFTVTLLDSSAPQIGDTVAASKWFGLTRTDTSATWKFVSATIAVSGPGTLAIACDMGFNTTPSGTGYFDGLVVERLESAIETGGRRGYDTIDGSGNIYVDHGGGVEILPHEQGDTGSAEKTIIWDAPTWIASTDATPWELHRYGGPSPFGLWIRPNTGANIAYTYYCPLVLPPGVTLTQVQIGSQRNAAGDQCDLAIERVDVGSIATVASGSASTGRGALTLAASETISAQRYYLKLTLKESASAGNAEATGPTITYTMPDFSRAY